MVALQGEAIPIDCSDCAVRLGRVRILGRINDDGRVNLIAIGGTFDLDLVVHFYVRQLDSRSERMLQFRRPGIHCQNGAVRGLYVKATCADSCHCSGMEAVFEIPMDFAAEVEEPSDPVPPVPVIPITLGQSCGWNQDKKQPKCGRQTSEFVHKICPFSCLLIVF